MTFRVAAVVTAMLGIILTVSLLAGGLISEGWSGVVSALTGLLGSVAFILVTRPRPSFPRAFKDAFEQLPGPKAPFVE